MKEISITSTDLNGEADEPEIRRRGNRATRTPEILECAMRVFSSEGAAGFTQRRVAAEAGLRLSTLQHYFGTREELLRSTIETMGRRSFGLYRELMKDKTRAPEAILDVIVDNMFTSLSEPDVSVGAFAVQCWSLAEQEDFARELVSGINGELQDIFAYIVGRISPSLTASECTLRGALILSSMFGLVVYRRHGGYNMPDLDALRAGTKAIWRALSKSTP